MLKIKIISSGPDKFKPGQIIRVECARAYALIESGRAVSHCAAKTYQKGMPNKKAAPRNKKEKAPSREVN